MAWFKSRVAYKLVLSFALGLGDPKSQATSPLQLTGITMMHKVLVVYYLVAVLCGMSASIKGKL